MRKKLLHLPPFAVGLGVFFLLMAVGNTKADKVDDDQARFIQAHPEYHGFLTPRPPYPTQAQMKGIRGTVRVSVTFAATGKVEKVVLVRSSGNLLLDGNTTRYIERHWRNLTGKPATHTTSVDYGLGR